MEGRTESFLCKQKNRKVNKYSKRERKRYNGENKRTEIPERGRGEERTNRYLHIKGKINGCKQNEERYKEFMRLGGKKKVMFHVRIGNYIKPRYTII